MSLLRSARALLDASASPDEPDSGGLLAVAGGLYTYAVEEYGKLLLLGSLPEKGGIVSVPYLDIFRSHRKKFDAALENLPADCGQLKWGIFDPAIFDPAIFNTGIDASFASRASLLYLDMDPDGRPVAPDIPDRGQLAKAIGGLERAVAEWISQGRPEGQGG